MKHLVLIISFRQAFIQFEFKRGVEEVAQEVEGGGESREAMVEW